MTRRSTDDRDVVSQLTGGRSGATLDFRAEFGGVHGNILEHIEFFLDIIEGEWRCTPSGRVARHYLYDAIAESIERYALERSIECWTCHENFCPIVDRHLVSLVLKGWDDLTFYEDLSRCPSCGGVLHEDTAQMPAAEMADAIRVKRRNSQTARPDTHGPEGVRQVW